MECHVLFLGLLLGGANVEGRGKDQEKKLFIDNTAQALIPSGDILIPGKCTSAFKSHTHL